MLYAALGFGLLSMTLFGLYRNFKLERCIVSIEERFSDEVARLEAATELNKVSAQGLRETIAELRDIIANTDQANEEQLAALEAKLNNIAGELEAIPVPEVPEEPVEEDGEDEEEEVPVDPEDEE